MDALYDEELISRERYFDVIKKGVNK